MRTLVERASRWLVNNRRPPLDSQGTVDFFSEPVQRAMAELPELMTGRELDGVRRSAATGSSSRACPRTWPRGWRCSTRRTRCSASSRPPTARTSTPPTSRGCTSRSASGSACPALVQRILALPREDRWQTMARAALRDDLHAVHGQLTAQVLAATSPDDPSRRGSRPGRTTTSVVVARAVGHARGDLRRRPGRPGPAVGGAAGRPRAARDRHDRRRRRTGSPRR